jgi:hypothetical protein
MRKFSLVDFAAHYQKGFRNHLVPITDVAALVDSFRHYGCYATYFFFSDEVLTYMSAQADSPSIAGYEGKVWAPFFPIDIDGEGAPALEAARHLTTFLLDRWAVSPDGLQIYFSGAKGFHLMLDTRLFGRVLPSKILPTIFDALRRHIAQELPEPARENIDLSIKDRLRLLRLPNTIHEKSKLYKVILSPLELESLAMERVRDLARQPRPLALTDETGLLSGAEVAANAAASELFDRVRRQSMKLMRRPFTYRFRRPADTGRSEFRCAGAQTIWESHIVSGYRNNCAIRLASEFRLLGLSNTETEEKLLEWNERNAIGLPAAELRDVVHSAFQHRFPYRYSCRDPILQRYCPLADLPTCLRFTARAANDS